MTTLMEFEAPLRRRDTLQVLLATRGYVCSEIALRKYVREMGNYALPAATMREDIEWLAKHGLVKTHETEGVLFATLLERGRDVAQNDEQIDGVEPPDVSRA